MNGFTGAQAWAPQMLSILRIMSALLYIEHGTQKLFGFPASERGTVELFSLFGLAGVLETFGGLLLLIGLFTRPVAFVLSGMMAVAYFMAHAPNSFFPVNNGGDAAILFCFVFLYLFTAGPGPWSVDAKRGG
ncbi:MAG: DoxX family protein [Geminicoccaceae bacterium]